jgi:hypothetical protein
LTESPPRRSNAYLHLILGGIMKNAFSFALLASVGLGLSACTEDPFEGIPIVERDTKVDNANTLNAQNSPLTPLAGIPSTGSVTYDGVVSANATGDFAGSLYADMSMNVNFANHAVTGTITQVDLYDDFAGKVVETLSGTLTLAGTQTLGGVAGTATGTLTGVGTVTGVGTAALALAGTVRSDTTTADTVYGSMTGGVTGGIDLNLANGEFYGTTP